MSEQTFPQTYVKADQSRLVRNVRDAVKAKFDGFKPVDAVIAESKPEYVELQTAAKAAGIPANQRKDKLVEGLSRDSVESYEAPEGSPKHDSLGGATPDTLAEDPHPAKPDSEGVKGSTEAPKPTAPGKSSTRTTR